jgi:hypothetical protein
MEVEERRRRGYTTNHPCVLASSRASDARAYVDQRDGRTEKGDVMCIRRRGTRQSYVPCAPRCTEAVERKGKGV